MLLKLESYRLNVVVNLDDRRRTCNVKMGNNAINFKGEGGPFSLSKSSRLYQSMLNHDIVVRIV